VFSPIFRLHATNKSALERRPWAKPERHFQAARSAMQLRHALIPYIYSMAWRAHCSGLALVTPMYYGHMQEEDAFSAADQYYFGSELLAAPFVTPADAAGMAERRVWLPQGGWYNFFTGEAFEGGRWHTLRGQLEEIPVFARAGAILPLGPRVGWGGIENPGELDVHVFPGAENRFELYEDDGETTAYLQGKYALTPFTLSEQPGKSVFTIHPGQGDLSVLPSRRTYRIHLRGVDEHSTASLPGVYDPATRTYRLEPVVLSPDGKCEISIGKNG
jgi:alpha-glucosidase (family GH31 glycosyl hydrolase)